MNGEQRPALQITQVPTGPIATARAVLITAAPESELSKARRSTAAKLRGIEIPQAFASATSAAYARALEKPVAKRTRGDKRAVRRLARHERLIGAVEVGGGVGG